MRARSSSSVIAALAPLFMLGSVFSTRATRPAAIVPPQSTFFATAAEESYPTYQVAGMATSGHHAGRATATSTRPTGTVRPSTRFMALDLGSTWR
jgi:hypothetical protein